MTPPWSQLTWVTQVDRHAEKDPDFVAVQCGDATRTWAQLADRSNRLATWLHSAGVRAGDRVLAAMFNRVEFVEVLLAANRLGAIAVPANFRSARPELEYLLSDSGAAAVVTDEFLVGPVSETIEDFDRSVLHLTTAATPVAGLYGYEDVIAQTEAATAPATIDYDLAALIVYTSGTTGRPKGAMLSYRGLLAQAITSPISWGQPLPTDVTFVSVPLFHIAGVAALIPGLLQGTRNLINESNAFDAETFLDIVEQGRVTQTFLVPTQWQAICDSPTIESRDLSLRSIAWGAAPAGESLLAVLQKRLPGVRIVSMFGMTEMTGNMTSLSSEDAATKIGSVGKALPHTQIRVVDEDMNDVPDGEIGEAVYRAPTCMIGYWNKPAETAETFRGGWMHSGDLVRRDEDGFIYVVDRLKDMIISGGENIYSAELERTLTDHPKIREAAVIGRPHERWGETPVAYIVPTAADDPPTHDEVVAHCLDQLASYKKPTETIVVAELPRNPTGKILKHRLRELTPDHAGSAAALT